MTRARRGRRAAAAVLILGTAGCTGSAAQPSAAPEPSFDSARLRQLGICVVECVVTGRIQFEHPTWKRTLLLTVHGREAPANDMAQPRFETQLLAVGSDGTVHWRWTGGDWPTFAPATPHSDRTGHLFVGYNPGKYEGLLVLAPTADGFEDFGSLPSLSQLPTSRFYSVALVDDNRDGTYEIRTATNTCTPDCAADVYRYELHRWDGHDYRPA